MKISMCLLAGVLAQAGAAGAQTFEVGIVGYGKAENFFEPLSGDLMVTRSGSTIDRFDGLEGTPLNGMTARCFGSTTILSGVANGNGNCVFTDPDGDKVLQAWTVDEVGEGVAYGTWRFIGGTGRHEAIRGRGHFEQATVAVTGGKTTTIVGTATWPDPQ